MGRGQWNGRAVRPVVLPQFVGASRVLTRRRSGPRRRSIGMALAAGEFGPALHAVIVSHPDSHRWSDMNDNPMVSFMSLAGLPTPYAESVLDLVAGIPRGKAVAYGQVAEMLGEGGPRQVAHTMSHFGSGVPWWRVVRADGTPAREVREEALRLLRRDKTPMNSRGDRVDWKRARWQGP
jgi:alkylated DNA nucleotide flippase Atl1